MFTGIVEEVGEIVAVTSEGSTRRLTVRALIALDGSDVGASIAVNGGSLTVAALEAAAFEVMLIPHTLAATTLGRLRVGQPINIEADVIGKYVVRSLALRGSS